MSSEDKEPKKRFYFIFFSVVVIMCIFLDFFASYDLILTPIIIFIAIVISITAILYLVRRPNFFKEHKLFTCYSFIFIAMPWLLYFDLILRDNIVTSLILNNIAYIVIFLSLIPILLIDSYLFNKSKSNIEDKKLLEYIKNNLYYAIFSLIVVFDFFLIMCIYYNIISLFLIIVFILTMNSIPIIFLSLKFSFFKKNVIFSIYSFFFVVFPWLIYYGLIFEEKLLFSSIRSGEIFFTLFIFLIPIPFIGIIQDMIYKSFKKTEIVETQKVEEVDLYDKIPNLQNLIKKYVYKQLQSSRSDFKDIKLEKLDNNIKERINSKFKSFIYYLELDGGKLTKKQIVLLKKDCFNESEPIRTEIRELRKQYLDVELFGETEKPIGERIDELLEGYQDWETSEEGKI